MALPLTNNVVKKDAVILLLENSTDYLFQLDQAFRKAGLNNPLRVARYGNEAILYLKGIGVYGDRQRYPLPDIILIDLAVPDGSGLTVLGWVRRQGQYQNVPIIILIHPVQHKLLKDALDRAANDHYLNRDDIDGLVRAIKTLRLPGEQPVSRSERHTKAMLSLSL